jgi:hypothetical protein
MLNSLLEGSPLVPELSDLVQKDPDLTGKSFREIVDISIFDRSVTMSRRSLQKDWLWGCTAGIVGTSVNFVRHLLGPGPAKITEWLDEKAM